MSSNRGATWSFLTNHARVLISISKDPGVRLREIAETVGITERAVHRIVVELVAGGYLSRTRKGRRNSYTIKSHLPIPDSTNRNRNVGDLLAILGARPVSSNAPRRGRPANKRVG